MIKFALGFVVGFGAATGALYGWLNFAGGLVAREATAAVPAIERQMMKQLKAPQ